MIGIHRVPSLETDVSKDTQKLISRLIGTLPTTQANRLLSVSTPFGDDVLLLNSFSGSESISRMFNFNLQLCAEISNASSVVPEDLIGQPVTVSVALDDGEARYFNGIVNQFTVGERDERFYYYQAEVVPWLWLLTLTSDCRVFQDMTVPEIIAQVLSENKVFDYRFAPQNRSYTKWDYCVQYRETDFNFISRLMEQEGIFYFFEHEAEKHTLVLADSAAAHKPCPHQSRVRYLAEVGMGEREDAVTAWQTERTLKPGKFTARDYHFEMPSKTLEATEPSVHALGVNTELEVYDYPGEYAQQFNEPGERLGDVEPESRTVVRLRMEEEETPYQVIRGLSHCRAFSAGCRFDLTGHWSADNAYVLSSVQYSAIQSPSYVSEMEADPPYHNSFTCIPHRSTFRPPRTSLKPVVQGPQTAVVVGPAGEEIYTDKYGRVKVQFHWDREGQHNASSSCWIRVAQTWAGQKWGAMYIPRIGHEVIVDFLEGDPDQPLIVGSVYNAEHMPHYTLPEFKTLSYIKSDSSKGSKGFNELRFEDKKGKEQVFIHSQKRMDVRVLGSYYETNHANRHTVIGLPKGTEQGGNYSVTVSGDNDVHIKGSRFEGIDQRLNQAITGDVVEDYQSNQATLVTAKAELNAKEIIIEAMTKITLKVASSFITIDLSGVTIQGPFVRINSGGAAAGTGAPEFEDALDAETSDTGEPGYLDRPRRSGGGAGSGRRRRTLRSQHGPAVTRHPDGTFQVGRSIHVKGDGDYQQAVLNDLAIMSTTDEGQQLFQNLDGSNRRVDIQKPNSPFNPPNASASPGDPSNPNYVDATAAGQPVSDGEGTPVTDAVGNQLIGTGRGVDSTVEYDPTQWPAPTSRTQAPGDVILFHELQHSNHQTHGQYDGTRRNDNFDTQEEFNAIEPENRYRDERKVLRRDDHHDL